MTAAAGRAWTGPAWKRQLEAELRAVESAAADCEQYLRIAETLESFRERWHSGASSLDVVERQKVLRSLVKEVLVGDGEITICHSIPVPEAGGSPQTQLGVECVTEWLWIPKFAIALAESERLDPLQVGELGPLAGRMVS